MTQTGRETAKIYTFPVQRLGVARALPAHLRPAEIRPEPVIDVSGGWYHEAALRDADGSRKP
jgi:hypothetical protein